MRFILMLLLGALVLSCSTSNMAGEREEKRPHFENDIYPPFARMKDTIFTGYKKWYSAYYGKYVLNDTTPFPTGENGCYANSVYEVYIYKGQPRLTRLLSIFEVDTTGGTPHYYNYNYKIMDDVYWMRQNELGLTDSCPSFWVERPSPQQNLRLTALVITHTMILTM